MQYLSDAAWIKAELDPALIQAMRDFHKEHPRSSWDIWLLLDLARDKNTTTAILDKIAVVDVFGDALHLHPNTSYGFWLQAYSLRGRVIP